MVPFEPNFEEIGELPILGKILGREVIVVVEDGLVLRVGVIQAASGARC